MFVVKCSLFGLMILMVIDGVRSLVALPQVEDNGIRKAELIIRTTMNTLFSNFKLQSKKGRPRLQYFTLLHHYFITQTLEDQTTLMEIAKLTRVNKTAINNRMKTFITALNELFEEELNLFNEDYFMKPDNFDEADQFIEEYMRELEYKVNSNQSFDVDVEIAKLLLQHGKSKEFNDSKQDDVWKPSLNLTISGRRIFDGTYTSIRHYPFIGSVKYFDDFLCSCSIIKTDLVITAASCLQIAYNNRLFRENPTYLSVQVGSTFYESAGETIDVLEIYFHPGYKARTLENNLAIMRLKMRINFGMVKKVQVDGEANLPSAVDSILMLGWGATSTSNQIEGVLHNRLHYAILDFYSWVDCREIYTRELVTEKNFCAGYITKGGGACNRDVGAPGIVNGKLVGVASFGPSICGDIDKPTVFTKLYYYIDWIENILEMVPVSYEAKTTLSPETLNFEYIKQQILAYNLMKKALNKNKTESSSDDTTAKYEEIVDDTISIDTTITEPLSVEIDIDSITETSYRSNHKSKSNKNYDSYKFTRLNTDSHKRLTTNAATDEFTNEIYGSTENKSHGEKNKKSKKKAAKIRSPKYKPSEETSSEKSSIKTSWNYIAKKEENKQKIKPEPLEKKKTSSDEDWEDENSFKEKIVSKDKLLKGKLSKEISSNENPIEKISSEKTKVKHKSKGTNSAERSRNLLTELNDFKLSKQNNDKSIDEPAEYMVLQQNYMQLEDMEEREGKLLMESSKKRPESRTIPLTITNYPPTSSPETSLETKLSEKKSMKSKNKTSLTKETLKDKSTAMSSIEKEMHDVTMNSSITTQIQTESPYLREQRLMELLSKYQNELSRHNLSLPEDIGSKQRENVIKQQDERVTLPNIQGYLEIEKEKDKYTYNHESTKKSLEDKLKEQLHGIGLLERISSQAVKYQQFELNNTDESFYNSKGDITTDIQVQKSEDGLKDDINWRAAHDVDFDGIEKFDDGSSIDDKIDSWKHENDEFQKLDTISSSESILDHWKPQEIEYLKEIEKFAENLSSLEGKSDRWKPDIYKSDEPSKSYGKLSSFEDESDNWQIDHSYKADQTSNLSRGNQDKKDILNKWKAANKFKSYQKHLSFSKHKQDNLRRHKIDESDKTISDEDIENPKNVYERRKHISKETSGSSEES